MGSSSRSKLRIRTYNFTSFLENKFNIEIKILLIMEG